MNGTFIMILKLMMLTNLLILPLQSTSGISPFTSSANLKNKTETHTSCVNIYTNPRHISNLHATYVSNSLKQLIELVDSLTSASVPETLSMGPHGWSLDFGWTSFSTNKIARKKSITHCSLPRSSRAMWQHSLQVTHSSHFLKHFFFSCSYTLASHDGKVLAAAGKVSFSEQYSDQAKSSTQYWTLRNLIYYTSSTGNINYSLRVSYHDLHTDNDFNFSRKKRKST